MGGAKYLQNTLAANRTNAAGWKNVQQSADGMSDNELSKNSTIFSENN